MCNSVRAGANTGGIEFKTAGRSLGGTVDAGVAVGKIGCKTIGTGVTVGKIGCKTIGVGVTTGTMWLKTVRTGVTIGGVGFKTTGRGLGETVGTGVTAGKIGCRTVGAKVTTGTVWLKTVRTGINTGGTKFKTAGRDLDGTRGAGMTVGKIGCKTVGTEVTASTGRTLGETTGNIIRVGVTIGLKTAPADPVLVGLFGVGAAGSTVVSILGVNLLTRFPSRSTVGIVVDTTTTGTVLIRGGPPTHSLHNLQVTS